MTMATIFFSLAGEGRGHATRVSAVVEQLRREHRLVLFSSGHAFDMLCTRYSHEGNVEVCRIPGLQFAYRGGRLDYWRTLWRSRHFIRDRNRHILELAHRIRSERPELIVTDFEPLLPRAARACEAPFVSFDHQHFLTTYDLSSLPKPLQWRAWWMGRFVDLFYSGQVHTIVSSFYFPPLKPSAENVTQIGVLLRPAILSAHPTVQPQGLAYLRRFASTSLMDTLRGCGREVRIYGLGARPAEGNLRFYDIDETSFLENLASCDALISNAGNQLVGEALYLRKPVLALPETGNFEQAVNAHFLRESGGGDWVHVQDFNTDTLGQFLDRVPELRSRIDVTHICGNEPALTAIKSHLPAAETAPARHVALVA